MASFHKLKAWKRAQQLAVECSQAALAFPEHEQPGLAAQLRRACYRIPLNLAEGTARRDSRAYRSYLETARGSLAEVMAILELAKDLRYVEMVKFARLEALADDVGKMLYGLLRASSAKTGTPRPGFRHLRP